MIKNMIYTPKEKIRNSCLYDDVKILYSFLFWVRTEDLMLRVKRWWTKKNLLDLYIPKFGYHSMILTANGFEDSWTDAFNLDNAKCEDCGLPYVDFGLDTFLELDEWESILTPEEVRKQDKTNVVLCANCIVKRLSKNEDIVATFMVCER